MNSDNQGESMSEAAAEQEVPKLYGMCRSGNSYKVALLLHRLGRPFDWVEVDVLRGATRTPEFLALNPNGKVPFVRWPDGRMLAESSAILIYFAEGSELWPADPWARAQCLQWMFFEQYSLAPALASARFIRRFLPPEHERQAELPGLMPLGARALGVMEQHLQQAEWFSGPRDGVADIALYGYTHVAAEGGFDLDPYPCIRDWLERMTQCPGHRELALATRSLPESAAH